MRRLSTAGILLAAVMVTGVALAEPPGAPVPGSRRPLQDRFKAPPPATKVQQIPSSITIAKGRKMSFYPVGMVGCRDARYIKFWVEDNTLTIIGLEEGKTELMLYATPKNGRKSGPMDAESLRKPKTIPVTVTK